MSSKPERLSMDLKEAVKVTGFGRDKLIQAIQAGELKAKRSTKRDNGDPSGKYSVTVAALKAWHDSLPDA